MGKCNLFAQNFHDAYKECRNYLNTLIKKTKSDYYTNELTNAKNSKESWKVINELSNKKSKTTNVNELLVNGNTITGDKNIAEAFNQYFSTIGPQLARNIQHCVLDPLSYVTLPSHAQILFRKHYQCEMCIKSNEKQQICWP